MATLRQQIGQMLIMGFAGTSIDENKTVREWLSTDGLGGVLLFDYDLINKQQGKNLVDQQQIRQLTEQLNHYSDCSRLKDNLPLFIAIDYEGGVVDRLSKISGCIKTIRPCELAKLSEREIYSEAGKMADMLKSLGFNLNFAPLVDLNLNEEEGIIGRLGRSFSSQPKEVANVARIFVEAFAERGISSCYKHFPGHGSAVGDSHLGFVDVTNSFHESELEPYATLLKNQNLPAMIMTAHVINRKLDPSALPATLSKPILSGLLREQLGYKGVIISDDLQMQAISNHYSVDEALCLTINAGADMVIFANQLGEIGATAVIDKIERLVCTGQIQRARIKESFDRICHLKQMQMASV